MNLISENLSVLRNLCRRYKVNRLYAFGSVLTSKFNDDSDVDIPVDFNEDIDHNNYADNYFDFHSALRSLFGREVDLVDESAIRNPYFKEELEETKKLIYANDSLKPDILWGIVVNHLPKLKEEVTMLLEQPLSK